jgi:hypothetical protein
MSSRGPATSGELVRAGNGQGEVSACMPPDDNCCKRTAACLPAVETALIQSEWQCIRLEHRDGRIDG